jgi:hypothetical protein
MEIKQHYLFSSSNYVQYIQINQGKDKKIIQSETKVPAIE